MQLLKGTIDTQRNNTSIGEINLFDDLILELKITSNGASVDLTDAEVEVLYLKSDKHSVRQKDGIKIEGDKIEIKAHEQANTCNGFVIFQVIIKKEGRLSSSEAFYVVKNTIEEGLISSKSEIQTFDDLEKSIEEGLKLIKELNATLEDGNGLIEGAKIEEDKRVQAEKERLTSEANRVKNEAVRTSSEITRVENETLRLEEEERRVAEEDIRKAKELKRQEAEAVRIAKEVERVNAEERRVAEFTSIKNESETLTQELNTSIDTSIKNEKDRETTFEGIKEESAQLKKDIQQDIDSSKIDFSGYKHQTLDQRLEVDFDKVYGELRDATLVEYEGMNIEARNTFQGNAREVEIKGNTIQNLVESESNERVPVTMEKVTEYSLGNQTFTDLPNGHVGVSIKGRTLQNLFPQNYEIKEHAPTIFYTTTSMLNTMLKPSTKYTVVLLNTHPNINRVYMKQTLETSITFKDINNKKALFTTKEELLNSDTAPIHFYPPTDLTLEDVVNTKILILEGDYTNEDIPYFEGIMSTGETEKIGDKYKVGVKSCGKNLLNLLSMENLKSWQCDLIGKRENEISLQMTGNEGVGYYGLSTIKVKPNTQYIFRSLCDGKLGVQRISIFDGVDLTKQTFIKIFDNANGVISGKFTTPPHVNELTFYIYPSVKYPEGINKDIVTFSEMQLVEGENLNSYKPYVSDEKYLLLDTPPGDLPNGTADTINYLGVETKRVGKIVFNGSENWVNSVQQEKTIRFVIRHKVKTPYVGYCDKFLFRTYEMAHGDYEYVLVTGEEIYINISIDKLTPQNVLGFKEWLKNNPVTVYYELETPVIIDHKKNLSLKSYEEVTHLLTDNTIAPYLKLDSDGTHFKVRMSPNLVYTVYWNATEEGNIKLSLGGGNALITPADKGMARLRSGDLAKTSDLVISGVNNAVNNVQVVLGEYNDRFVYQPNNELHSVDEELSIVSTVTTPNLLKDSAKELTAEREYVFKDITHLAKQYFGCDITISADVKVAEDGKISMYGLGKYGIGITKDFVLKKNTWYRISSIGKFDYTSTDPNGDVCRLSFYGGYDTGRFVTVKNIKISLGHNEENVEWIPHVSEMTKPSELYNGTSLLLNEELRNLPNGVCDSLIDMKNGQIKEIRRVREIVFNGSGNWLLDKNIPEKENQITFYISINDMIELNSASLLNFFNDKFPVTRETIKLDVEGLSGFGKSVRISIFKNKLTSQDVEGFKNWLRNNPVTVYYELETPVETIYNIPLKLKSYEGTTYILGSTETQPFIKGKIQTDVNALLIKIKNENALLNDILSNKDAELEEVNNTLASTQSKLVKIKDEVREANNKADTSIEELKKLNEEFQTMQAMFISLIQTLEIK